MDQNSLVNDGHALLKALDDASIPPRLAMWVHSPDTDIWKLWVVPPSSLTDKRDFYRQVAKAISRRKNDLAGLDASDTEMILDTHPAAKGLKRFMKMPGFGGARFTGNTFNGFYLPDGIILRVNFD